LRGNDPAVTHFSALMEAGELFSLMATMFERRRDIERA
jgi:hypothetical protein